MPYASEPQALSVGSGSVISDVHCAVVSVAKSGCVSVWLDTS